MRALPIIAVCAVLALAGTTAAQTGSTAPPSSDSSTVDNLTTTVRRGLDRVGEAAKAGASDLWAAGKAAYAAGARTLHEREAARDTPQPPAVADKADK